MKNSLERGNVVDDAKRYARRLWAYLSGLEKISRMIDEEIAAGWVKIDNLLEKILPFLCKIFNSDLSFVADENRIIILTNTERNDLLKKSIPDVLETTQPIPEGEPLVIIDTDDTDTSFPEFKEMNINSILILKAQIQERFRWIGICNGKNEPEPYLGEDKKFLNELIRLFNFGLRFGKIKIDSIYSDQYKEAFNKGDWGNLFLACETLIRTYSQLIQNLKWDEVRDEEESHILNCDEILANLLDAWLCDFILKFSSTYGSETQPEKQNIREIFKYVEGNETFYINLPIKGGKSKEIKIKEYKRAALAGARIRLTDFYFLGKQKEKGTLLESSSEGKETLPSGVATAKDDESLWELIKCIINLTDPKDDINIEQYDSFEWLVDWLRTQWLHIFGLARQCSVEPVPENIKKMQGIYTDVLVKTVELIRSYLSSGSRELEDKREEEEAAVDDVITMDSDWLLAFLAQNVLLSRSLNQYYGLASGPSEGSSDDKEERRNPLTRVRYLLYLSHFVLYILHCARFARRRKRFGKEDRKSESEEFFLRPPFADVPPIPDTSLSETFLFILSEYAYREIGVPRELLIFEKLRWQLNFELPLYASSDFYRDHCYHVMDVCLLGEFLLKCGGSSISKINKRIFSQKLKGAKKIDLLKNWYVASLCHDLGYVVEQVEKLMSPVGKLKAQGLDQFTESLKKGLETGKSELNKIITDLYDWVDIKISEKLKEQMTARIQALGHGVIGWLYLCQLLKNIGIPLSSMAPALLAVLRHNLADHDGQIHQEPLSLLLLFCDHLQEWGRPRVAAEQLACGVMESLRFPGREPYFEKKVLMNRISIKGLTFKSFKRRDLPKGICDKCIGVFYSNKDKPCFCLLPLVQKEGLEFQLSYLDAREADFEPVLSWLFFCRDFQCVDYSLRKFLFPVSIRFSHSLPKMRQLLDWRVMEMDIFEEFTNTHEEAAYLCQWIESARNNLEGIKYDVMKTNDGEKEIEIGESFTIHLDRLGRPLARGLEDKHWKDFVRWKWRWLAQKYIVRNVGRWYPGID